MVHCVFCNLSSNGQAIFIAIVICISLFSITHVDASIHEYKNEAFIRRSNSFFFHGGSEGLYASRLPNVLSSPEDKPLNGKSFIRLFVLYFFFFFPSPSAIWLTSLYLGFDNLFACWENVVNGFNERENMISFVNNMSETQAS